MEAEVIIVGSGASAVHMAQTLLESNISVLMLDVGNQRHESMVSTSDKTFTEIRKTEPEQYKYFLGEKFESLSWGSIKTGAQLSAARLYMLKGVEELTPKNSSTFFPYESLACGGLGVSWGAGCYAYSKKEIAKCHLNLEDIESAYKIVAKRIGVSQPSAGVVPFTTREVIKEFEPMIKLSSVFQNLHNTYVNNRQVFSKKNFSLGVPSLALLGRDREGRRAHGYREMDFYDDNEKSIYRPWMTLDKLKESPNFAYDKNMFVTHYVNHADRVEVHCINLATQTKKILFAKRCALAAGVLGTARIVLRSHQARYTDKKISLPLLCNSYSYIPSISWSHIGQNVEDSTLALSQMLLVHQSSQDETDVATGSIYGYKSLLLQRLIKESFLPMRFSRELFQFLQSGFVILGVHHPDEHQYGVRRMKLMPQAQSPTGDQLVIDFVNSDAHTKATVAREKKFSWAMRQLGCWPIKKVNPGLGASIHYAGSLPYSDEPKDFALKRTGQMHSAQNVFVGDGSGLRFLPAKGLTFTLMAIGHVTANNIVNDLKAEVNL